MHNNGFVAFIKSGDVVLRENYSQEVFLPYNSEYSIGLKNISDKKALVSVHIDGTNVLGGSSLIIDSKSDMILERFILDGNLNSGKRFKFVSLDNPGVQDPSSSFNGEIKIEYQFEKFDYNKFIEELNKYNNPYPSIPLWGEGKNYKAFWRDSGTADYIPKASFTYCSCNCNTNDLGATIEGSNSNQIFKYGNIGELDYHKYVIILKLRHKKEMLSVNDSIYCINCGNKVKINHRYCFKCGNLIEK